MKIISAYVLTLCLLMAIASANADVQIKTVEYNDGDVVLQGYFAWDDAIEGRRPGVVVAHEWWGLNDYARTRAEMLAKLGYVALAIDMYGKGKVTEHANEASAWMKQINANTEHWQLRARLGLDVLRKHEFVDPTRLAAIGYCFGGSTVMQLAYSGATLKGVVSFHGSLPVATKQQARNVKASVLIAHGNADTFVPSERIAQFTAAMDEAHVDWQMVNYGGARHSFTNPNADRYGIKGVSYNKQADRRSWRHMQQFFDEIFSGEN